jgi:hypothetical protein
METIENLRMAKGVSVNALCKKLGRAPGPYFRARSGRVKPRQPLLRLWRDAIEGKPLPKAKAVDKALIASTYRGFLAAISTEMQLDPKAVAASDPSLSRVSDPFWMAAARARAMAVYCTNIELGVPGTKVAEAAGMTKQAVSECLKRVEDLRDDPATDALVERVSQLLTGRVE